MTDLEHIDEETRLTRRQSLLRLAGAAAVVGGAGGAWKLATADGASASEAVSKGLVQCVLTPELTEGPYYVSGEKLRRDITEASRARPCSSTSR